MNPILKVLACLLIGSVPFSVFSQSDSSADIQTKRLTLEDRPGRKGRFSVNKVKLAAFNTGQWIFTGSYKQVSGSRRRAKMDIFVRFVDSETGAPMPGLSGRQNWGVENGWRHMYGEVRRGSNSRTYSIRTSGASDYIQDNFTLMDAGLVEMKVYVCTRISEQTGDNTYFGRCDTPK